MATAIVDRPWRPFGGEHRREYDAIVVGAGHNGLVAANYLRDAGLDVAILERRPEIGGMTRTDRPILKAPDHCVNHCAVDPIFWPNSRPAADLALEQHGLGWVRVDPAFAYLHPTGESVAFWRDPRKTAADIRRFSRPDAAAYLELAELFTAICDVILPMFAANPTRPHPSAVWGAVRGAVRHRRSGSTIARFLLASGHDEIAERFTHPVVRSALHMFAACLYPASFPGSTAQMLLLAFVHRFECLRPIGGTQAIPDALARRFTGLSGHVLVDAQVAEITTTAGRATGVVLTDGRELRARQAILTACDPQQALGSLLRPGTLPPRLERRATSIPGNDLGWGQLKVDVACSGLVDLSRFERERDDDANIRAASHLLGTEAEVELGYRRAAAGSLPRPEELAFYNAIPTAADPSQAPLGQDSIYLLNVTSPPYPDGGWTPDLRRRAVEDTVQRAALFYGDLLELELGRSSFTNEDMAHELGTASQSHAAFIINRLGPLRPASGFAGYSTPVQGLYLGGAGSHPGAAVTGTPGYLGAREVLRDLRKSRSGRARRTLTS